MGLKAGGGGERTNIFINPATVVSIEDISSDSKADVAVKVTVQQENLEYTNSFNVSGWHKYDQLGQLDVSGPGDGWGSSFKVRELFENCGMAGETLTDDSGRLLPHVFNRAQGQQIWIVRYPNKEGKRWTWDRTSSVLQGRDHLQQKWNKDVSNGYPKDYDLDFVYQKENKPSLENRGNKRYNPDDFPYGANKKDDSGLPPDDGVPGIPSDL